MLVQCQIDCFEYFYQVCMMKNISRAASNIHISQSALSQQLKKLENSLGCELLTRSNKGVELTELGSVVLKYADGITKNYRKMLENLSNVDKYNNMIKIEACLPVDTHILPNTLYRIKKKYPHHNYELNSNSSENIKQDVLNNICDIGFVCGKPKDRSLLSFKIGADKLVLVTSSHFRIPERIYVKNLLEYPLIILENFNISEKLDPVLKNDGYNSNDLDILFNFTSIESIKSLLFKRCGVSFLPYESVKKELQAKQLKLIDVLDFTIDYDIYLINKMNGYINNSVTEFLKYFKQIGLKECIEHFEVISEKEVC
jgi:DNA-binding transcriptional LysR family regulator